MTDLAAPRVVVATDPATDLRNRQVRVLTTWQDFESIREEWDRLHRRVSAGLFSSSRWLRAWQVQQAAKERPDQQLRIVTIWREGCLVAAAPMGLSPLAPTKYFSLYRPPAIRMLGDEIAGFADWLVQWRHEADALAEAIVGLGEAKWLFLESVRIRRSSEPSQSIEDAFRRLEIPCHSRPRFQSTVIDISRGWDGYFESRSREFRKMLRGSERRATDMGAIILTEKDGGETVLDRVIDLSARSWKGRAGTGIGATHLNQTYLRALWREFAPSNDIHLHVLMLAGREAGHAVTIDCNGVTYGLFTDFDEEFAAVSPGRLMVMAAVRDAAARGIPIFDMLRRTHYLARFSEDSYETCRLVAFPRRNAAWLTFVAEACARRALSWLTRKRRRRARRIDFIQGNGA